MKGYNTLTDIPYVLTKKNIELIIRKDRAIENFRDIILVHTTQYVPEDNRIICYSNDSKIEK